MTINPLTKNQSKGEPLMSVSKELREDFKQMLETYGVDVNGKYWQAPDDFAAYANNLANERAIEARMQGAEDFHKHIFNHFDLLPKIQGQRGNSFDTTFNEGNYQAVACEYLEQLKSQSKGRSE